MHEILTEGDVAVLLAAPVAVLYKHSPICPTSSFAYDEILELRRRRDVPVFLVNVVARRPLARVLAERIGVAHASPQAIILRDGIATWHGSHYEVQADAIARVLDHLDGAEAPEPPSA
jgi:monothiol bacilliredoxin